MNKRNRLKFNEKIRLTFLDGEVLLTNKNLFCTKNQIYYEVTVMTLQYAQKLTRRIKTCFFAMLNVFSENYTVIYFKDQEISELGPEIFLVYIPFMYFL